MKFTSVCRWCGIEFATDNTRKKYCSKEHLSLKKHHNNKKWKETKYHPCINCNKEIAGFGNKFCCQDCSNTYRKIKRRESFDWNRKVLTRSMRTLIMEEHNKKCSKCGWGEINPFTQTLPLEIEHIDGNSENNQKENLTVLCPNCHALTQFYKGANKGNGRHYRRMRYKEGKSY